jgi:hypothetical protein
MLDVDLSDILGFGIPPQLERRIRTAIGRSTPTEPAAVQGSPPTATMTLQDALARIPLAEAGHVIGPDYHNRLYDFCRAVTVAFTGTAERGLVVDVPLRMQPTSATEASLPWSVELGAIHSGPENPGREEIDGWTEADLPNGATITGVKVVGRRSEGKTGIVTVLLHRARRTSPTDRATLVRIDLTNIPVGPIDTPLVPVQPDVAQLPSDQVPLYARIDRSTYRYLLQATVRGERGAATTRLYTVQVACDRF